MQANMQQALLGSFKPVVVSTDSIPELGESARSKSYDIQLTFTDRHGESSSLDAILNGRRKVRGDIASYTWSLEDKWTLLVPFDQAKDFAQTHGVDTTNSRAFNTFASELRRKLATITMLGGPEQTEVSFDSFHISVTTEDR